MYIDKEIPHVMLTVTLIFNLFYEQKAVKIIYAFNV